MDVLYAPNVGATMPIALPFDVDLLILDQCRKDKATLAACSLVCQAWLSPSRSHLFRDVTIEVSHQSNELFVRFMQLLLSSTTQLGKHVHTLRIVGRDLSSPWIRFRNPYSAQLRTELFYPMITQLPHLRTLFLVNVRLSTSDVKMLKLIREMDARPSIEHLEINSCLDYEDNAIGMINLISLFASIRTLVLDLEYYGGTFPQFQPLPPHSHQLNVRSLIVRSMAERWTSTLYQHFKSSMGHSGYHHLECINIWPHWGRSWAQLVGIGSFVSLHGSAIRALRINPMQLIVVKSEDDLRGHWNEIQFASCVNLRSLLFSLDTTGFAHHHVPDAVRCAYEGILEILMDPELPPIETLTFHLTVPSSSHLPLVTFNWEFVDEVLSRIRTLQSVIIASSPGSVTPTQHLSQRLRTTAARGLLEFHTIETDVPWWEVPV